MDDILNLLFGVLVLFLSIFNGFEDGFTESNNSNVIADEIILENFTYDEPIINLIENVSFDVEVRFCPYQNCSIYLSNVIKNTTFEVKCAFYELSEKEIVNSFKFLSNKNITIELIVDDGYLDEKYFTTLNNFSDIKVYSDKERGTKYNNYMHDKFCVIDDKIIITGSTNPSENGLYKNNNNIVKFESVDLSKNFENEFDQMKAGIFGRNKKSVLEYNNITLVYQNNSYVVATYFCPQDDCLSVVLNELNNAKSEILFASFAFTHDDIASALKMKSYQGINVSGILETRNQNLQGSDYSSLKNEFSFVLDKNKNTMHHKFFIIDGETVVTGSMNPTGSGVDYNDENIIIIRNERFAQLYRQEFFSLVS